MDQGSFWRQVFFTTVSKHAFFYVLAAINALVQAVLFLLFCVLAISHWPTNPANLISDTLFSARFVVLLLMYYLIMLIIQRFFRWVVISLVDVYCERQYFDIKSSIIRATNQLDRVVLWGLLDGCLAKIVRVLQHTRVARILMNFLVPVAWGKFKAFAETSMVANDYSLVKAMQHSYKVVEKVWGKEAVVRRPIAVLNRATIVIALVPLGSGILMSVPQSILYGALLSIGGLVGLAIVDDWVQSVVAIISYRFTSLYDEPDFSEFPEIVVMYLPLSAANQPEDWQETPALTNEEQSSDHEKTNTSKKEPLVNSEEGDDEASIQTEEGETQPKAANQQGKSSDGDSIEYDYKSSSNSDEGLSVEEASEVGHYNHKRGKKTDDD